MIPAKIRVRRHQQNMSRSTIDCFAVLCHGLATRWYLLIFTSICRIPLPVASCPHALARILAPFPQESCMPRPTNPRWGRQDSRSADPGSRGCEPGCRWAVSATGVSTDARRALRWPGGPFGFGKGQFGNVKHGLVNITGHIQSLSSLSDLFFHFLFWGPNLQYCKWWWINQSGVGMTCHDLFGAFRVVSSCWGSMRRYHALSFFRIGCSWAKIAQDTVAAYRATCVKANTARILYPIAILRPTSSKGCSAVEHSVQYIGYSKFSWVTMVLISEA